MADQPITLLDTSAAIPFVVAAHSAHRSTWDTLSERRLGMAGHAWFETFSVLTRMPGTSRRDAAAVSTLMSANFSESRFLDEQSAVTLAARLADAGISGGAVYDAMVASAAALHELPLASRDRRAAATYRSIGVEVEFLI